MKRSEMVSAIESYLIKNDISGAKLNGEIWANEILEVIEKEGMVPPVRSAMVKHQSYNDKGEPRGHFELLEDVHFWEPEEVRSKSGAI